MIRILKPSLVLFLLTQFTFAASFTPLGAEKEGKPDGSIPQWIENPEQVLAEVRQFTDEKPLYVIDGNNYQSYATMLSAGQIALFREYPDSYQLPVYRSHRTHIAPRWIHEATAKNAKETRLLEDGINIANVWPGIPFPFPEKGIEVVWNHLLHWRGVALNWRFFEATIYPDGTNSTVHSEIMLAMPFYQKDRDIIRENSKTIYYMTFIKAPARLAGGGLLVHESLNTTMSPRQAWVFLADQNRVRRLPRFDYDTALFNSENLRVVDEIDLFSGSPDRYHWQLIGKKELLVPYNSNRLADSIVDNRELQLVAKHLLPDNTRYELHRVWVVEGHLKDKYRHIYPRRTLYIDEDSWIALMADMYDVQGKLWRTSISHTHYRPKMKGVWKTADVYHDLRAEKYFIQSGITKQPNSESFDKDIQVSDFSPAALRRQARK